MKRLLTITAAAFAVAALAGPSSAFAGATHFLGTYKVEKHLDLEGQDSAYTISCEPGDIAIDGMWRIDNVDQDNDYVYPLYPAPTLNPAWEVLKSVEVVEAYATSIGTYRFKFSPQAGADVQGKLFLVCLPGKTTQSNGHQHSWTYTFDPSGPTFAANSTTCTSPTQIAIQPGFINPVGAHAYARLPALDGNNRPISWFHVLAPGVDGTLAPSQHWSCLDIKSAAAGSPAHSHRIVSNWKTLNSSIGPNQQKEFQIHCGEHYKAVLASWNMAGFTYAWWLGMDPRPKTRAFKVFNQHDTLTEPVSFGALCFKDRTT
jgi:hypothetical protein